MNEFHGTPGAARSGGPRETDTVSDFVHLHAGGVAQDKTFAFVTEGADERADGGDVEGGLKRGRIFGEDEETVGGDLRARGKGKVDAAGKTPTGEVDGSGAGVVEFDEFERDRFIFGIVVDFVNDDVCPESGYEQAGSSQSDTTAVHANGESISCAGNGGKPSVGTGDLKRLWLHEMAGTELGDL